MTLPVLGLDDMQNSTGEGKEQTIAAAMALGVAFQMTNILRDVGEDARRGRIYLPLQDLRRFGITEEEILKAAGGQTDGPTDRWSIGPSPDLSFDDRWRAFMRFQIERCKKYYEQAETGAIGVAEVNRLGVMAPLYTYQGILEVIKRNGYDNFSRRAYVDFSEKVGLMGKAWLQCEHLKRARPGPFQ